jgi:hypothetical protein
MAGRLPKYYLLETMAILNVIVTVSPGKFLATRCILNPAAG